MASLSVRPTLLSAAADGGSPRELNVRAFLDDLQGHRIGSIAEALVDVVSPPFVRLPSQLAGGGPMGCDVSFVLPRVIDPGADDIEVRLPLVGPGLALPMANNGSDVASVVVSSTLGALSLYDTSGLASVCCGQRYEGAVAAGATGRLGGRTLTCCSVGPAG